ncbi:hypothetical protein [Spongiactinospora rosea]|uniref:hypothetical protein n=1 Tax=Spongiactinospora rosea TaxID=2248750 RepID=UPI001313FB62|nr:hypothetical protein [Spongiactinospora rosea]
MRDATPGRRGTGLALPGNYFWLFDGEVLPDVIKLCGEAFEAVRRRAVPHGQYRFG